MEPTRRPRRRPLVVVDDPDAYPDVLAEVAGAGWELVDPTSAGQAHHCVEWVVGSPADLRAALLSAVAGCGVVVRVGGPTLHLVGPDGSDWADLIDDLVEDLASVGPVLRPRPADRVSLDRLTWQVVHDLARGLRLEAAAARAHLSLRTANRRVGDARDALGAGSRAELLTALGSAQRVPAAVIER